MAAERESWHLDRRVPLALILALTVQTGGIVWWAATLQANGEALQSRVEKLEAQASSGLQIGERIARLEERLEGVRSDTGRIERLLRALVQEMPKPCHNAPTITRPVPAPRKDKAA